MFKKKNGATNEKTTNVYSLDAFKLYYEAEKNLDITQAIFISHSLVARMAARISKWLDNLVRT